MRCNWTGCSEYGSTSGTMLRIEERTIPLGPFLLKGTGIRKLSFKSESVVLIELVEAQS